ncbi:response regulator [Cyclobacterium xiamenense]|uniref:ATP-binding response regulator n=1 Tax=Cyclobacterium xiamenense TaxID=1297121 RepID=UPI0035D0E9F1
MNSAERILLVEDEPDLRNNLRELLELKKYTVITAENGQEALEVLENADIDLIVSDILMPIMNGYELLQKVRESLDFANVPFIFLSAKVSKGEIREGMEGGAEDYLTKPVKAAELFKAVEIGLKKKGNREAWAKQHLEAVLNKERNVRFHELRTPLFGVLSILELLDQDLASTAPMSRGQQADWVGKAFEAAKRLNKSLLKLTLFQELGSVGSLSKKRVSVFESLGALRKSEEQLPEFTVRGEDQQTSFNQLQWDFVLLELLENASKFGVLGKPIYVLVKKGSLSMVNSQQIFDRPQPVFIRPFYQTNREYQEQQGLGIGLYLVQSYCELNGASLKVEVNADLDFVASITFGS